MGQKETIFFRSAGKLYTDGEAIPMYGYGTPTFGTMPYSETVKTRVRPILVSGIG